MSTNIVDVITLVKIAEKAGSIILPIYRNASFSIEMKKDHSPLTEADIASHDFICNELRHLYPNIPVISEESHAQYRYSERKKFTYFFLVDPLDGTKEFIKKNGEFTINIALIHKNRPLVGVIHAPVFDVSYYAEDKKGAYKYAKNQHTLLSKTEYVQRNDSNITGESHSNKMTALVSRSHGDKDTELFLKNLRDSGKKIETISVGSALKFGWIAEGKADIYPRFSPSMEWDTAAGHVLINEVGKKLLVSDSQTPLVYNKKSLLNPGFVVS